MTTFNLPPIFVPLVGLVFPAIAMIMKYRLLIEPCELRESRILKIRR